MSGEYDGVGPWRCTECGHEHAGRRLAWICIGCPCEFVPDHPEVDAADARIAETVEGLPDDEDFVARPALGRTNPYSTGAT